jgi:hypothetical protein
MPILETPPRPAQRKKGAPEGRVQSQCYQYFHNTYPQYRGLYFAVPNENSRVDSNSATGAIRRAMGVTSGVSDTLMLIPKREYHGFCIEYKTEIGRQSPTQIEWQRKVEEMGYKYAVVRSLEQFKELIKEYLEL